MPDSTKDRIIRALLTPPSWIYRGVTFLRNKLFDLHVLPQERFDIPVVAVGNLSLGGTGKTPHVEYLINQLAGRYNIAMLSRGYKRKTRGFILASQKSTPDTIGDEPYQIYQKFGSAIQVAVCENRRVGIRRIQEECPEVNLIIMDDGLQHRYVIPKVSILLMEYSRPVYNDELLPLGRLRESQMGINRADIVIVTKCPETLLPINCRIISNNLNLFPYQKLFFSKTEQGALQPVFPDDRPYSVNLSSLSRKDTVMLLTCVANPRNFVNRYRDAAFRVKVARYPDHHDFSRREVEKLVKKFDDMRGERKIIVTTEKDAARLSCNPYIPRRLKSLMYFVPLTVRMVPMLDSVDLVDHLNKLIQKP